MSADIPHTEEWFKTWFDTAYYHLLYRHRDENEAAFFIHRLIDVLDLRAGDKVMDLACGRGRHSITLHDAGFEVLGLDLSKNSIRAARTFARPGLRFEQWDMRNVYPEKGFACVFNLFTSFGYFDSMEDNLKVLRAIHSVLAQEGKLVLDYLNPDALGKIDGGTTAVDVEEVQFRTSKYLENDRVIKEIEVKDGDETHQFKESVQLIDLSTFQKLFREAGLQITQTFGDYDLGAFVPESSPRIILIAEQMR
ncbi:MAG: methyltransferase domain-containing protein [Flavobacteriales bacterium]|nr:methyltransferase domain-containing protein [Flavobacteriales bacterium]